MKKTNLQLWGEPESNSGKNPIRDMIRFSQTVNSREDAIPHELAKLLQASKEDADYKAQIIPELITYISEHDSVKKALQGIAASKETDFAEVKSLAQEVLTSAATKKSTASDLLKQKA